MGCINGDCDETDVTAQQGGLNIPVQKTWREIVLSEIQSENIQSRKYQEQMNQNFLPILIAVVNISMYITCTHAYIDYSNQNGQKVLVHLFMNAKTTSNLRIPYLHNFKPKDPYLHNFNALVQH